jgi:hypothetical protein
MKIIGYDGYGVKHDIGASRGDDKKGDIPIWHYGMFKCGHVKPISAKATCNKGIVTSILAIVYLGPTGHSNPTTAGITFPDLQAAIATYNTNGATNTTSVANTVADVSWRARFDSTVGVTGSVKYIPTIVGLRALCSNDSTIAIGEIVDNIRSVKAEFNEVQNYELVEITSPTGFAGMDVSTGFYTGKTTTRIHGINFRAIGAASAGTTGTATMGTTATATGTTGMTFKVYTFDNTGTTAAVSSATKIANLKLQSDSTSLATILKAAYAKVNLDGSIYVGVDTTDSTAKILQQYGNNYSFKTQTIDCLQGTPLNGLNGMIMEREHMLITSLTTADVCGVASPSSGSNLGSSLADAAKSLLYDDFYGIPKWMAYMGVFFALMAAMQMLKRGSSTVIMSGAPSGGPPRGGSGGIFGGISIAIVAAAIACALAYVLLSEARR